VLKNNGLILFSTFGPNTLKELKKSWAVVDNKPHVNTFADMHDIGDQLLQSGFQSPVMEMETLTLTYQSVTDLLRMGFIVNHCPTFFQLFKCIRTKGGK
jgi:malonyl-CoA O-methyltransferase